MKFLTTKLKFRLSGDICYDVVVTMFVKLKYRAKFSRLKTKFQVKFDTFKLKSQGKFKIY